MAYGARLESGLGASPQGFESPILRHDNRAPPPDAAQTGHESGVAHASIDLATRPTPRGEQERRLLDPPAEASGEDTDIDLVDNQAVVLDRERWKPHRTGPLSSQQED